jgi:hypothetical protein
MGSVSQEDLCRVKDGFRDFPGGRMSSARKKLKLAQVRGPLRAPRCFSAKLRMDKQNEDKIKYNQHSPLNVSVYSIDEPHERTICNLCAYVATVTRIG